jgi:hypothetical protein
MTVETRNPFVPGLIAFRKNIRPILVIQVAIISLVVGYYIFPQVREVAGHVSNWKDHASIPALFAVGMFAGGLLPEIAKAVSGHLKPSPDWFKSTLYNALVYGGVALLTNVFYNALGMWFGQGSDPRTVVTKTCVDMFVATPLMFTPFTVTLFEAYALGFDFKKLGASLSRGYYRRRIVPTLVMAWGVWIPVLSAMYALPLSLQFPTAMLAEAAWSIMVVFVNVNDRAEPNEDA